MHSIPAKEFNNINKKAIELFLKICRKEIAKGNCHFINRTLKINGYKIDAKQALLDLGIMKRNQIWQHILELKINDCIKIEFDYDKKRDNNTEIYIFKKIINRKDVYIKLTMRPSGIICISFHESY